MNNIKLNILGCGSATPTPHHFPTSQLLEMRGKQFLIDCGEGTQIRIRQMRLKTNRLGHIFISHLHGDHCLGLMGLISTFNLMGRTAELHIHSHPDLETLLRPQLDYFTKDASFEVIFHPFNPSESAVIYDDRSVKVITIPLKHRVPTCGFLFKEKVKSRHIIRDMIDFYQIPVSQIQLIKNGADYISNEGVVIPNDILTTPPTPPFSYAYCSDTAPVESIIPIISGVNCLYHETTFGDDEIKLAEQTQHSTARQAAEIAKKANVGKLLMGHYSARYPDKKILLEQAKEVFEYTEATDDMSVFEF